MTDMPAAPLRSDALESEGSELLVGAIGVRASGWWGLLFLILSDTMLFAYEFFAYFWYSIQPGANWIPGGPPTFLYSGPQSGVVLLGCASAWYAHHSIRANRRGMTLIALGITLILGAGFIALQFLGWFNKPFGFASSTYSSIYFLISGTHLAHFVIGWVMFLMLLVWTALGYFDHIRHVPILVGALYWYWLAALWLAVFFVVNGTPYFF